MYKYLGILFVLISADINAQEIPDYKGEYVFTNSRISVKEAESLLLIQKQAKEPFNLMQNFHLEGSKLSQILLKIIIS